MADWSVLAYAAAKDMAALRAAAVAVAQACAGAAAVDPASSN